MFKGTPHEPVKRKRRVWRPKVGGLACDGCDKTCVFGVDYYMVTDLVWFAEARLPSDCMLCRACLSTRIGRSLVREDYTDAPINRLILKHEFGVVIREVAGLEWLFG